MTTELMDMMEEWKRFHQYEVEVNELTSLSLSRIQNAQLNEERIVTILIQSSIALSIISVRFDKKLSREEFAHSMGVSTELVEQWEHGVTDFSIETLARIAAKLDISMCSPYDLEEGGEEEHRITPEGSL